MNMPIAQAVLNPVLDPLETASIDELRQHCLLYTSDAADE